MGIETLLLILENVTTSSQQSFAISTNMLHAYSCISHFNPAPLINVDLECELQLAHVKQSNVDTQHSLGREGDEKLKDY